MATTPTTANPGTVDITNLVTGLQTSWVAWATLYLTGLAGSTIYTAWLNWPVISIIFTFLVKLGVTALANALEMQGFFLNTAIRKASQAQDFISALNAKDLLPSTATDEEYENAEKAQMVAFRKLVIVTD